LNKEDCSLPLPKNRFWSLNRSRFHFEIFWIGKLISFGSEAQKFLLFAAFLLWKVSFGCEIITFLLTLFLLQLFLLNLLIRGYVRLPDRLNRFSCNHFHEFLLLNTTLTLMVQHFYHLLDFLLTDFLTWKLFKRMIKRITYDIQEELDLLWCQIPIFMHIQCQKHIMHLIAFQFHTAVVICQIVIDYVFFIARSNWLGIFFCFFIWITISGGSRTFSV